MEQETVKEIIAVEKEIQRTIDAAKDKWQAWLAEVCQQAEKQYEKELAALEENCEAEQSRAAEEAKEKAAIIIKEGEKEIGGWRNIADDKLEMIVRRHLEELIAGERNDSPDVQN